MKRDKSHLALSDSYNLMNKLLYESFFVLFSIIEIKND